MLKLDINLHQPRVAVLLPCLNEATTIASVINAFREALVDADIYVYDNNSDDGTGEIAAKAGAIVRYESRLGKGNVVRRMFAEVDADVYILADGDGTYAANEAPHLVKQLISNHLDMVVGTRVIDDNDQRPAYRRGHLLGNWVFNKIVGSLFGPQFTDIFSGYRAISYRLVKSFPILSEGFEIEAELSIYCLDLQLPTQETPVSYIARKEGGESKLRTVIDGFHILVMIIRLLKSLRPLTFFVILASMMIFVSIILTIPLGITYFETGLLNKQPSFILIMALTIMAMVSVCSGFILESLNRGQREIRRMAYLSKSRVFSNSGTTEKLE